MVVKRTAIAFAWAMLAVDAATAAGFDTQTLNETNAVLFNEKVLQGALSDIAKMQEAELRAFTRYLSVCKTLGSLWGTTRLAPRCKHPIRSSLAEGDPSMICLDR